MRRRLLFLIAVAGTGFAFVASGAIAGKANKQKAAEYGRKVMREFAECSVKHEPVLSRRFVLTDSVDEFPAADFQKIAGPRCLPVGALQLQMLPLYYRGALAEQLIRDAPIPAAAFDTARHSRLNWPAPTVSPVEPRTGLARSAEQVQKIRASRATEIAVGRLGECVVRATPAGALAVLKTKMDDPSELSALKSLAPQIAGCIKAGETSSFNRTNLRSAIALSYYRLAYAAGSAGKPEGVE